MLFYFFFFKCRSSHFQRSQRKSKHLQYRFSPSRHPNSDTTNFPLFSVLSPTCYSSTEIRKIKIKILFSSHFLRIDNVTRVWSVLPYLQLPIWINSENWKECIGTLNERADSLHRIFLNLHTHKVKKPDSKDGRDLKFLW